LVKTTPEKRGVSVAPSALARQPGLPRNNVAKAETQPLEPALAAIASPRFAVVVSTFERHSAAKAIRILAREEERQNPWSGPIERATHFGNR
jgi:hypothetical protein